MKRDEKDLSRYSGGMSDAEFDSLFDDPEEGVRKSTRSWWDDEDGEGYWKGDRGGKGYGSYGYGGSSYWGKTKGALSDWWGRGSGGFKKWWNGGSEDRMRYSEALRSVRRIGRIIYGDKLTFTWAGDHAQAKAHGLKVDGKTRLVQLSPDPLNARDVESEWTAGRKVDALVGDTMSRAAHYAFVDHRAMGGVNRAMVTEAMKQRAKQIAKKAGKPNLEEPLAEAGSALFNALDYLYTERQVTNGFPGYRGYFEADRDFVHRPTKKDAVEMGAAQALAEDPKAFMAAAAGTLWNTLRPQDGVELSPDIDAEVIRIAQELRRAAQAATEPAELLAAARKALDDLAQFTILDNPNCKNPEDGDAEGEKMNGLAGEMGMAGDRGDPSSTLDEDEADNVERLVSQEWTKEAPPSGKPGMEVGDADVPTYTIKAQANRSGYDRALRSIRPHVAKTRSALLFRNELQAMDEIALRRGMVDEGSLHKLLEDDPAVFRRQDIISAPEVDIGFLVDESGSMHHREGTMTRAQTAQLCAVLLVEACRGLRGVSTSVWGHTGNDYALAPDGALVYRYLEAGAGDMSTLGSITARQNNFDGHAIEYCWRRLRALGSSGRQKVLFVLADGYPSGAGYGGRPAQTHVRDVCDRARKAGVEVYCLGMGDGLDTKGLEEMYGANGYVIVPDVAQLPRVLSKLLGRVLRTGRAA